MKLPSCITHAYVALLMTCFTVFSCALTSSEGGIAHSAHAYVAVCVLAKNEHVYIREFIKYHLWLGVGKFYIWDHQSSPPLAYVLEDYVLANVAEVFYFSDSWKTDAQLFKSMYYTSTRSFMSPQGWAYDNCFRMFAHRHTFMALLDPDEYIVLKEAPQPPSTRPHLPTFLAPFEAYGGIAVHWQLFGPSGHVVRPRNSSTLESYTQCMPREALQRWREFVTIPLGFTKSITATRCYQRGCNPHVCELKPGCKYVNEKVMDLSSSVVQAVHWDRIAIFHYVTRSVKEYKRKMSRGSGHSQYLRANSALGRGNRGWRYFKFVNSSSTAVCLEGRDAWERCCKTPAVVAAAEGTGGLGAT